MKELDFPQESLWWWYLVDDELNVMRKCDVKTRKIKIQYPAYTVAELGEMYIEITHYWNEVYNNGIWTIEKEIES